MFLLLARLGSAISSNFGGIAKVMRVVGTKSGFYANEIGNAHFLFALLLLSLVDNRSFMKELSSPDAYNGVLVAPR